MLTCVAIASMTMVSPYVNMAISMFPRVDMFHYSTCHTSQIQQCFTNHSFSVHFYSLLPLFRYEITNHHHHHHRDHHKCYKYFNHVDDGQNIYI